MRMKVASWSVLEKLLQHLMKGFLGILKREMFYCFEKHFKNLTELEDAIWYDPLNLGQIWGYYYV